MIISLTQKCANERTREGRDTGQLQEGRLAWRMVGSCLTAGGHVFLSRRGLLISRWLFLSQTNDLGDLFPSDFRYGSLAL